MVSYAVRKDDGLLKEVWVSLEQRQQSKKWKCVNSVTADFSFHPSRPSAQCSQKCEQKVSEGVDRNWGEMSATLLSFHQPLSCVWLFHDPMDCLPHCRQILLPLSHRGSPQLLCWLKVLVASLCLTLCKPIDWEPLSMEFSRQESWSGWPFHSLLQRIFLSQGSNQGLLH